MSSILKVKNLSIGFNFLDGFVEAVHGVSFELGKGETLAIVGESGCGKTISTMSVLRLLPENSKITSGEVYYDGQNLLNLTEKQMQKIRGKKIALIPQDPMTSLNPLYTVGNQLLEIIELHQGVKGKEAERLAVDALERVKIPDAKEKLKAYPHEFSGGMKQRVIIAMALACRAEIIIADEPTTALDVTVQAQIMDLLKEVKEKNNLSMILITHDLGIVSQYADNLSMILITHDLGIVSQYADKIAVMYAGHIVEFATKEILFKNPKHPYTRALLKVILDINSTHIETIEGQPPAITEKIAGCPFYPRCKNSMNICQKEYPQRKLFTDGSAADCWLY